MLTVVFDRKAAPCWLPLQRFLALLAGPIPVLAHRCAEQYGYSGVGRSRCGMTVHFYKHLETRRTICLDDAGHSYEMAVISVSAGRSTVLCRCLRSPDEAALRLRLEH